MTSQQDGPVKVEFCTRTSQVLYEEILPGLCRSQSKISLPCVCIGSLALVGVISYLLFSRQVEHGIAILENQYLTLLKPETHVRSFWLLPLLGFAGGLIASVSPCILALLPLNLSYIGTLDIESKRKAFLNAFGFVCGVVLVLSLLGLFSSFAGALMVDYKGYVNLGIGLLALLVGASFSGLFEIPVPQMLNKIPTESNSFLIGTAFALVSSPCASPVLFTMLAVAGSTGNHLASTVIMASYALGYTMILFLAGLLTGVAKQVGVLRRYASEITIFGGLLLVLVGGGYIWSGIRWFIGSE